MSDYQKKIPHDYNISVGNAKKLVIIFSTEKYVLDLRLRLKIKKKQSVLEFDQLRWRKPYIKFNTQKIIEAEIKW